MSGRHSLSVLVCVVVCQLTTRRIQLLLRTTSVPDHVVGVQGYGIIAGFLLLPPEMPLSHEQKVGTLFSMTFPGHFLFHEDFETDVLSDGV